MAKRKKKKANKSTEPKAPKSTGKNKDKSGKASKPGAARKSTTRTPKPTPQIVITLSHDEIANRAFAIWQRKGRPVGRDAENWKQAEKELLAERKG